MTEWSDIIKTVLGASVGSAILSSGFTIWRDRRKRRQDSTYLAMRLAVILEAFACDCADLIARNENAVQPSANELPIWVRRLPTLVDYPDDSEGWKALKPNDASDCLNLPSRIFGSQAIISEVGEQQEMDIERAVRRQASERGIEAWNLAQRLRLAHGLQPTEPLFDYVSYLMDIQSTIVSEDLKRHMSEFD